MRKPGSGPPAQVGKSTETNLDRANGCDILHDFRAISIFLGSQRIGVVFIECRRSTHWMNTTANLKEPFFVPALLQDLGSPGREVKAHKVLV
jgi:hypothetical protein